MKALSATRTYTIGEEIYHSVIHGLGIILSVAGLAVLAAFSYPI
jgi:hemolysin III